MVTGKAINDCFEAIATLRLMVFSEYPYCYQGSFEDEQKHFGQYTCHEDRSLAVLFEKNQIIGLSTRIPAASALPLLGRAVPELERRGVNIEQHYYVIESMIKQAFRGKKRGQLLYQEHEVFIRRRGYQTNCLLTLATESTITSVEKKPFTSLWHWLGFKKTAIQTSFTWLTRMFDHLVREQSHVFDFWARDLT